jgi:dihydroceramide fatty acyl 2-hydroxylase
MDARRSELLKASPRMFDSDLLDMLSRVHPAVPVVIYVPAIALLIGFALVTGGVSLLGGLGLFAGGYAFWTLCEYWIHRIIFHFEPEDGFGARLHWIIHGVHHDHPNDPLRLVMPPSVSVPLAVLFYLLFGFLLPAGDAQLFTSGFLAGYLAYDMTHFYVHHRRPKTAVGKRLREWHMRHHFQDETKGFGVSMPLWDYVFRTSTR